MRISSDLKIIGLSELYREEGAPVTERKSRQNEKEGAPVRMPRQSRQELENVKISDPSIGEESEIVYSQIARDVQATLS